MKHFSAIEKERLRKEITRVLNDYYEAKHHHRPTMQNLFMELQLLAYEIIQSQYYAIVHQAKKYALSSNKTDYSHLIVKDEFVSHCLVVVSEQFRDEKCKLHEGSNVFGYIVGIMKRQYYAVAGDEIEVASNTIPMYVEDDTGEEWNLLDQYESKGYVEYHDFYFEALWEDLSRSIARNEEELDYMRVAILEGIVLKKYSQREVALMFHITEAAVSQKNKKLLLALQQKVKEQGLM